MKPLGEDIALDRADLIMVTETNSMLQWSRVQTGKALGAVQKVRHVTDDEKTCQICIDLDGEQIDINEPFA